MAEEVFRMRLKNGEWLHKSPALAAMETFAHTCEIELRQTRSERVF